MVGHSVGWRSWPRRVAGALVPDAAMLVARAWTVDAGVARRRHHVAVQARETR